MADQSSLYTRNQSFNNYTSSAEVPSDRLIDLDWVDDNMMFDPDYNKYSMEAPKLCDPLMADGKIDHAAGGIHHHHHHHPQASLELDSTAPVFASNNFWLNSQQASNQAPSMAFQPVSMSSQLPPVGAEYQIQTGMDSMASPYSPESEGSYDDPGDTFQLRLPPGFDKEPIQKLTEEQLVSLSARDLNTICRDLPEDVVKQLKKRRRTLKNRGYAYNSRVRRVSQKNQLEKERDELQKQISQLQDKVKSLEREAEVWKRKAQIVERGDLSRQL